MYDRDADLAAAGAGKRGEIERAIRLYEDAARCPCDTYAQIILEALREQAKRKNLNPLTIEQLRERDGKPVWITSGKDAVCAYNGWAIVGRYYDDTVTLYVPDNVYYEAAIKHSTIIVYDYPPTEAI
ncbi:MAG: hypothetical protein EOM54_11320 [Clostridia bacterium]|nr:hypothetical protein [Clostridia bacterium]